MGLFDLAEIRLADLEARVAALEGAAPVAALNVLDYGAVGDGVANDVAAIQSAIDACALIGGGTVYLPAGTYYVNGNRVFFPANYNNGGCLAIRNQVTLQGAGMGQTIIAGGTQSGMNTVCAASYLSGVYSPVRDIGLADLTIQGSGKHADCVKLWGLSGVYLHDVELRDSVYSGANIVNCNRVLLERCVSHGHPVFGFAVQQSVDGDYLTPEGTYAQDIEIRDCEAYGNSYGFQVAGNTDRGNILDVALERLFAHDNSVEANWGKNLWLWRVTGFTAIDCEAFRASTTSYNFFVDTCTNGAISHTGYKTPGGTAAVIQSCANVSETGAYLSTREE
jgi:hypothetical protein